MWQWGCGPDAMNAKQLITITVAALFLIGGATAVGAAAPADQASDNVPDASTENTDDTDSAADTEPADDATSGVGPSDGLPEQAPDRVSTVLETIESFQNGEIDDLGGALSDLLGDQPADEAGESSA